MQADLRLHHLPLIAVTSFARNDGIKRATAAGLAAHIGKPILLDTFAEVMGQVRNRAAAKAGSEATEAANDPSREA